MKTIGIVLATYNGEKFLTEQIDSILNQTVNIAQIVVVDDCSKDKTLKIVDGYHDQYPELFSIYMNEENLGPMQTFLRGIEKCNTDYIALSDQDDVWKPEKLEKVFHELTSNPEAKMCFHDLEIIGPEGNLRAKSHWRVSPPHVQYPVIGAEARNQLINFSNPVHGCTMLFDAGMKKWIFPIPSPFLLGHDWWISAVCFFLAKPVFIYEQLGGYRLHPEQAAGIGMSLKREKGEYKSTPFSIRIKEGLLGIFHNKRRKKERLIKSTCSQYAMCNALLKLIEHREELNGSSNLTKEFIDMRKILIQRKEDLKVRHPGIEKDDCMHLTPQISAKF